MTRTSHPADALATVSDDLGAELRRLAGEFTKVADNAPTIEDLDKWQADANQLRFVAVLTIGCRDTGEYDLMAEAWISAARRRLEAELAAVHESRATRRLVHPFDQPAERPNVVGVPASVVKL